MGTALTRGASQARMTISRIAFSVLLVVGCSPLPIGGTPAVDGRTFLSTSVTEGGSGRPLVENTRIRIAFSDGRMMASAGCNTMGATYRIEGEVLVTTDGAVTEIGCDPERHAQDEWLFGLIGAQPVLRLSEDRLIIEEGETVITLLDREIADPDLPLIGPTWTVAAIVTDDTVSSVPDEVMATLVFTTDGGILVNTGCNRGGGKVTVGANTLRFTQIAMTLRACGSPAGDVESAVLMVLGADVVAYAIEARMLEMTVGDHGLQLMGDQ